MVKRTGGKIAWMTAFVACVFFIASGFTAAHMPRRCRIEGEDVSGKTLVEAAEIVNERLQRDLEERSLVVLVGNREYEYRAPALYYETNLQEVLTAAMRRGRGKSFFLKKQLRLAEEEEVLRGICADFYRRSENAHVFFRPDAEQPLAFTAEKIGRYIDGVRLQTEVRNVLSEGGGVVTVPVHTQRPDVTLSSLKANAERLSSFTTYFNLGTVNRAHNIALASKKLCCVIEAGEIFSFNAKAGARTRENGYREAPVIQGGAFVTGVGGGVCQVSTTVYNAALLAGMQILEYHPHSLAVGYVEPSFDAMVNGTGCDLRFKNTTGKRVYLVCRVKGNALTVQLYGKSGGITYTRESVVVQTILPPDPEVREGTEDREIRAPKNGLKSEGYLIVREAGKAERRIRMRRDTYAPIQGIFERVPVPEPEQI